MGVVVLALLGGGVAGLLALWRAPALPRHCWLLALATLPQLGLLSGMRQPELMLISAIAILYWCWPNRAIAGVPLVTLGTLLNLTMMVYHGGAMPIALSSLQAVGRTAATGALLIGSKDVVVSASGLWWLADWLTFAYGKWAVVASPGDIILLIGIGWWLLSRSPSAKDQHYAESSHSDT